MMIGLFLFGWSRSRSWRRRGFDDFVTGCLPGVQSAQQRETSSFEFSRLFEQVRRTGACVFGRSGAVGNDAFVFGKTAEVAGFDFAQHIIN